MRLAPKGNNDSRLFTEVKPRSTGLISGWVHVAIWIDFLCRTPWTSITPSTSTTNVVCGLSLSPSQPNFDGLLRFPPSSKSTPNLIHLAVEMCSEVIHGRVQGPSAQLAAQVLRSDLVELRPWQFGLRLRERAIRRSDITNHAVRVHHHLK